MVEREVRELRHEDLVERAERVAHAEQPVELVEALPGDREDLVDVHRERVGQRRAAVQPQRDAVVLGVEGPVRAGYDGGEVGRLGYGLHHLPAPWRHHGGLAGAEHLPLVRVAVRGHRHRERERCLEVRLVEAGEQPRRVVEEHRAVQVDPAVRRVDMPVQPLALVGVRHVGHHDDLVGGREVGQREPAVRQRRHVERAAVQRHRMQRTRLDVQKGIRMRPGRVERDRRGRPECIGQRQIKLYVI
jgi:hypothetical protein